MTTFALMSRVNLCCSIKVLLEKTEQGSNYHVFDHCINNITCIISLKVRPTAVAMIVSIIWLFVVLDTTIQ